jgi:methylthioribose-1-phosphate isomerase
VPARSTADFHGEEADPLPPTVEWRDGSVRLIDQRRLPEDLIFIEVTTVEELCEAISTLAVRGAPALGVAGAMGVALAANLGQDIQAAASRIVETRPTAVNLQWGVRRALAASDPILEATVMAREDVERNRRLGAVGAGLLADGSRVLTHCNAGSLACVGYGTAVGVIRAAHESGKRPSVWVDETRPVLQGSRLTAWELDRLGIPATVVVDAAAGSLMANGQVDCVIVGADRIAANGDVANKIGTYSLAVLARYHRIPFYVAAPVSTIDSACASGAAIPVEQRVGQELAWVGDHRVTPTGTAIANPAFDITPARLVSAIVTEDGVAIRPYRNALARLLRPTTE